MHFDKEAYKIAKSRIISLIQSTHDWENTEGFIADGVICPDVYQEQHLRVLCILAESYGYAGCKMKDIEDQREQDVLGLTKWDVGTPRRLASLLYLLQQSAEIGAKLTLEDFLKLSLFKFTEKNMLILQDVLSKIAWMNVKKASNGNGTKLNVSDFRVHARRNQEVLRQQIEAIAPNLILVCGEAAFRALYELRLLGPELSLARKWKMQVVRDGVRVIEVTHPGYFRWAGYPYIYKSFDCIYTQLASRE